MGEMRGDSDPPANIIIPRTKLKGIGQCANRSSFRIDCFEIPVFAKKKAPGGLSRGALPPRTPPSGPAGAGRVGVLLVPFG